MPEDIWSLVDLKQEPLYGTTDMSAQQRLRSDQSLVGALCIANESMAPHADNEGSDQTVQLRRLIWVFILRICPKVHFLVLWQTYWIPRISRFADSLIVAQFMFEITAL